MKSWDELTTFQKTVLAICISLMAIALPEIMFFVQLGGAELAFALLMVTFQPFISWVTNKYRQLKESIGIAIIAFNHSASARPAIFATQATFCVIGFVVTSSWLFALSFFVPSLVLNGLLI